MRTVAREYTDITYDEKIVDAACMHLVMNPEQFDVLVMPNLYGDIVSDLCAGLVGGLGVVGAANLGTEIGVFEAVHGSAPDIAGKNVANPTALLLSAVMMLRHIDEGAAADRIMAALGRVLTAGTVRTRDLGGTASTFEFADARRAEAHVEEASTRIGRAIVRLDPMLDDIAQAVLAREEVVKYLAATTASAATGARADLRVPRRAAHDAAAPDLPRAAASALPDPAEDRAHARATCITCRRRSRPATAWSTPRITRATPTIWSSRSCSTTTASGRRSSPRASTCSAGRSA